MRAFVGRLASLVVVPVAAFAWLMPGQAVADTSPSNTVAPSISGFPQDGQTLTADPGTWTGSPSPTFTYEWYECDAEGANCVDTGRAGNTYMLADPDVGHTLEVQVTASGASQTALSAPTTYVLGSSPTVVSAPTLSGGTEVGDTLTATTGTWAGYPAPDYSFVWFDCNPAGADCAVNVDASNLGAPTYTLTGADAGHTIKVEVIADNGSQESADTNRSGVVTGAPQNLSAPRISGTAKPGAQLTATVGRWTGGPTGFRYSWWDCGSGGPCRRIGGATGNRYRVTAADSGYRIEVRVSAENHVGRGAPGVSAKTLPVTDPAPARLGNELTKMLPATGAAISITGILEHRGYRSTFVIPTGGRLTITWVAMIATRRYRIAGFAASYHGAGRTTVTVGLTAMGMRLLRSHERIAVTSTVKFRPTHHGVYSRDREFSLTP